ncbi:MULTISPECIES: thioredoxin fold domain-containing protein [unclassified Agarivorans]|uniref:thioredoxin fold domain-containing protein n=1 Tax=unclassified Agarivorans TaxID=2636026 RepID=UPI003D7E3BF6
MKLSKALVLSLSLLGLSVSQAWSNSSTEISGGEQSKAPSRVSAQLDLTKIQQLIAARLGVNIDSIAETPLAGIYEVVSSQGIFYVSQDGNYLLQGSLFDLVNRVNLTDQSMSAVRLKQLANFEDDMITFKAKDEKYVITVFTDTSCGYCRKLHSELYTYQEKNPDTNKIEQLPGYTDLGITVRYLAFPRGGLQSPAYHTMQNVWCADDKAAALSSAKQGGAIAQVSCKEDVIEQYHLGEAFGVRGTPAMVLQDGRMLPGYRPPAALLELLQRS